jgi:putative ABC transport system substrate-binding protein
MVTRIIVVLLASLVYSSVGLAQAQQPKKVARVGYLSLGFPPPLPTPRQRNIEAFYQGLREEGYSEGKNLIVEYRYAEGDRKRIPELATELVSSKVDLIVATSTPVIEAARRRPLQFLLSCNLSAILLVQNSSIACRDPAGISPG